MADLPLSSSPDAHYEKYKIMPDQENLASSPLRQRSMRPRKPPTVTPKRFTKFFTPRRTQAILAGRHSKAGRQLRDITQNGANRRRMGVATPDEFPGKHPDDFPSSRPSKRRKLSSVLASSPLQSSPLKRVQTVQQIAVFEDEPLSAAESDLETLPDLLRDFNPFPTPIRRLRERDASRRILERSFGGYETLSRGRRGPDHDVDPRAETANFVTVPSGLHQFRGAALPFCTTSCNTNSLMAVGDEEGSVRLIDSSTVSDFTQPHVKFRVHHNAIMDIAFSSDDLILATVSGDQTARVVDMLTQRTMCVLSGHKSSVKQVRFQPNSDHIITTSSKDGTVMVWDLRTRGKASAQSFRTTINGDGESAIATTYTSSTLNVGYGHRSSNRPYGDDHELSITSFQHLPHGREHLIVTASEVNASVKLWDLRNASRRYDAVPLSSTRLPESHSRTRNFGINSLLLSGDGARLYTVCRDATVYAYSTNHLMLGHAPEMSSSSRRRLLKEPHPGLGPLYGFRHPSLRIGSFYIKAALRQAKDDHSEMLAIGSTDRCPVLFPTDERYLQRRRPQAQGEDDASDDETMLPSSPPKCVKKLSASHAPSDLEIFNHGTALVGAHRKEVTSLSWTHDGDLVSVSDDFTSRCWREDAAKARELRACGEGRGERWGCGWSEVESAWDELE